MYVLKLPFVAFRAPYRLVSWSFYLTAHDMYTAVDLDNTGGGQSAVFASKSVSRRQRLQSRTFTWHRKQRLCKYAEDARSPT